MAKTFRLLIYGSAETDAEDCSLPWLRSVAAAFSSLDGVEIAWISQAGDGQGAVTAFADRTNVCFLDPSTTGSPATTNDGLDDASVAATLAELHAARGFDALLVRSYGIAVQLAGIEAIRGRLWTCPDCFPVPSSFDEVRDCVVSVVSASSALLCETEDTRSRIEYLIPESRKLTVRWRSPPPEGQACRLIRRLKPDHPTVRSDRKLRVLIAGHDLKFIDGIIDRLSRLDECELRIDQWSGFAPRDGKPSIDATAWADVIVCEWCGANAVWYSRRKRRGQRLIVRLHRFEITTSLPYDVQADAIDQLITVCPNYQQIVRKELTDLPAERIVTIPNYADCSTFQRDKIAGAHLHIGLVGAVPKLKRLDLALDILQGVRRHDERFCLIVKSKMPWELPWLWNRADERRYFRSVLRRVQTEPLLEGAVVFDPFGSDVANWFRKIGTVLSTSDAETFHVGALEGMTSGAVGVILPWKGADQLYGDPWVVPDVRAASERILETAAPHAWDEQRLAARQSVQRYDLDNAFEAWANILVEDRDPDAWT